MSVGSGVCCEDNVKKCKSIPVSESQEKHSLK